MTPTGLQRALGAGRAGHAPDRALLKHPGLRSTSTPSRARRIVLYSHDTMGLGHMRRNLAIARALRASEPQPAILLIGGAHELGALAIPDGVDCLTLPALGKRLDGSYQPRSLPVSLQQLVALRSTTIAAAIQAFDPDVLIVDKVPLGVFNELEPALRWLRACGRARCVLGLREVLDTPSAVLREWQAGGYETAIRHFYDAIWIYGDAAVYDTCREYGFSREVVAKSCYTGYVAPPVPTTAGESAYSPLLDRLALQPGCRVALCCVGGGQDGQALANAFVHAAFPDDMVAIVVTGPFMPEKEQRQHEQHAADNPHLRILRFVDETAPLLRRADFVVAMGGYNTVCEVLAYEKQALIVPRVTPRTEQLIRAARMRELGLIDMLHPDALTPMTIGAWLDQVSAPPATPRTHIDLNGLARLPGLLDRLFASTWTTQEAPYAAR